MATRYGRPLRTVPVARPDSISTGDHIIYQINSSNSDTYRPIYRSALVESGTSDGNICFISYTSDGLQRQVQPFTSFKSLHKVDYTFGAMSGDDAVCKAKERLDECHYHGLFNNSHHFVSWAKTGLEYSLTDLVYGVEEPWIDNYELKPVLMKSSIDRIEDINPGDHIMESESNHWLVESVDAGKLTFTGFTVSGGAVKRKESVPWKKDKFVHIHYPPSNVNSSDAVQKARSELDKKEKWDGSDKFITKMKWGKSYAINEASLIDSNCAPVSCTPVTPYIVLDRGDHLIVKTDKNYRSVLVEAILDSNKIICLPDLKQQGHGNLQISGKEVYRVNYKEHLPTEEVIARAESREGQQLLMSCQRDSSLFVSWAITGRQSSVKAEELLKKQELKLVRPICYKRITSETCSEIQPGDHLFIDYPLRYNWHYMVTEVCAEPNVFKTVYYLRGSVKETVETIDPSDVKVYKVIYAEEFPPEKAIDRARSRVGKTKVDLWARVEFVRWAKTGSDEGVEVEIMTNSSTPSSKSSIACFKQLNPGDYLVVDEGRFIPYHHCLVLEVSSPTDCTVIEVWNRRVRQSSVKLDPSKRNYRLNYNTSVGVCKPAKESIALAGSSSKLSRQKFVNFLKTGEDSHYVDVNLLKDDRILLPRKKIESARELKRGDHIERPLSVFPNGLGYYHHMIVLKILDDKHCEVVHCNKGLDRVTGSSVKTEVVDIFKTKTVSRVKYTERIDPEEGTTQLLRLASSGSQVGHRGYNIFNNNCEHIVMIGTIGTPMSIQVDVQVHQQLHKSVHSMYSMSPGLGDACMRAASKGAVNTAVNLAGIETGLSTAIASSFRIGYSAALAVTTMGLVSGIALGTNIIVEAPLLAHSIYKIHRKKKFDVISSNEVKRKIAIESITSANTIVGGTGGAIAGQLVFPIPFVGAAVGGFCGIVAGKTFGNLEGRGVALLIRDKDTDLPVFLHCVYVSMQDHSH